MSLIKQACELNGWNRVQLGASGFTQPPAEIPSWSAWRGVWFTARHPSLLLPITPAVPLSLAWLVGGVPGVVWLVVGVLVLLIGVGVTQARRGQGRVFLANLWRPWRWWVARWFTYGYLWPRVALRCRLGVQDHATGQILTPRVSGVCLTASGECISLELPVGLPPEELTRKAGVLAHALGTTRPLRVQVSTARGARVWVHRRNPLAATVPPLPMPTLDVQLLKTLSIGKTETGQPWSVPVWGSHIFCGGLTGSGKGSILWSLLHGLAPFIREGLVQIWAVDPKGGMELEHGAGLFTRFERDDPQAMAQLLEDAATEMDTRCRSVRSTTRLVTPTPAMPLVVVIVDELASLTSLCMDRKIGIRVERALGLLATKGRAPGFALVAFTQEVSKETARWRDLFPTKIALRLAKPVEVDMVLGDGAWQAGAQADAIPRHTPGSGYVLDETSNTPVGVRASWIDDNTITRLAATYAPQHVQQLPLALPELNQPPTPHEQTPVIKIRQRSPRQSTRARPQRVSNPACL